MLMQLGATSTNHFYPRPPRGGRRVAQYNFATKEKFLSTPSARRATRDEAEEWCDRIFLSTPSARRATLKSVIIPPSHLSFLSTPSARRATQLIAGGSADSLFLSTPSARRATRAGSVLSMVSMDFYPRPPRGGRPMNGDGR